MSWKTRWCGGFLGLLMLAGGGAWASPGNEKIIYLHHSTGGVIWDGGIPEWFDAFNGARGTHYEITSVEFPKDAPYGWNNYPYDYWNIWVQHAGEDPYQEEPTLEILTRTYDVIVWKHCFPVSELEENTGNPDVGSSTRSQENYRLQYLALREKMRSFPQTLFVVWTGAVHLQANLAEEQALRMRDFVQWIRTTWDEPGDNIVVWDFYQWETDGELYLKDAYAASPGDSHPNEAFARRVAPFFCQTVVNATSLACRAPLQGHGAGHHAATLRVRLRPAGGGAEQTAEVPSAGDGAVSLFPPAGGEWRVSLKERRTLSTVRIGAPRGGVVDFGPLRQGDANDDDRVTIVDFSILATTFGKSAGEVGYDDRGDFNGDQKITILDFSLLASNFGGQGEAFSSGFGPSLLAQTAPPKTSAPEERGGCQGAPDLGAVLLTLPLGVFLWRKP